MIKAFLKVALVAAAGIGLMSCAPRQAVLKPFDATDLNGKVRSGEYVQKADTLMTILDASGSMAEPYKGQSKLELARDLVHRMNRTIPDLKLVAGLRTFGKSGTFSQANTDLVYGLTDYEKPAFEAALKTVTWPNGDSPLATAGEAVSEDLAGTTGNIAVVIFSDGKEMDKSPIQGTMKIKQRYGDRICIYTVLVGDDAEGRKLLEQVAQAGQCGFSVTGDSIYSKDAMAEFVERVLLTKQQDKDGDGVLDPYDECPYTPKGVTVNAKGCPPDADGDGVYDFADQCPGTPRGVKVDSVGCPLDSDGDGVYDYLDKCPGTPPGVQVDGVGCPVDSDGDGVYDYLDRCPMTPKGVSVDLEGCPLDSDKDGVYDFQDKCPDTPLGATVNRFGCWVLVGVYFDTAKSSLKPESHATLNDLVSILKNNPALQIEIQGHTDNQGSAKFNQKLSKNRAKAVMEYLVMNGIQISRLKSAGYGLTRPVASNDTAEGRALNRRVELHPIL